jgi:hypothetical protein
VRQDEKEEWLKMRKMAEKKNDQNIEWLRNKTKKYISEWENEKIEDE